MINAKTTYRSIAFGFLTIFLSLLIVPTVIVTAIDDEVNISMVFSFSEEETKENQSKAELNVDDFFPSNSYLSEKGLVDSIFVLYTNENNLIGLYCPGIIVPPPELS